MSNDMYLPALPLIANEFKLSLNQIQLTITAWLAGSMSVQLLVGPWSDRYGRKTILLGGGLLFLLSALGCAMASTLGWLMIARFVQGIGVCSMMVAGYASVHDVYEDRKAIHILVWMGSAAVIAPAIGPVLGGLLLLFTSWRGIFLTLFLISILALIGLWRYMPESASCERLNLKQIRLAYVRIVSNSAFILSALSFGLAYGGVIGWITVSPFLLMEHLQLTPTQFGLMQIPVFGGYILGAQLVKVLLDKMHMQRLIAWGLGFSACFGGLLAALSYFFPQYVFSFVLPMVGYTLGFGFAAAPLNRITMTSTSEQKGAAMAIFYLAMAVTGTLISLISSIIIESVVSSCIIIGVSVVCSFALNALRRRLV